MRILVLANFDVGLYQFRQELITELLKKNEVYISLPYGPLVEPLKKLGCIFVDTPMDRRGMNPIKDFYLFKNYCSIIKKSQPDLVITYTIKPNIYGGLACRLKKVSYAINITGLGSALQNKGLLKTFVIGLYKKALKKAKVVFFENSDNKRIFLESKIVKNEITCVLPGAGVNLARYSYTKYPEYNDKTQFLFMARVMKEKGTDELFYAMRRLIKEGNNCSLDVLGEYEEDYGQIIEQYQNEGWLHYHGFQKDVKPYIDSCHCFVLPSWHEGMANTNLECAASGRPIITSNIPGCREAVINGKSGYLVNVRDSNDLYEKMKAFICLKNESRRLMGIEGRKLMEEVFDKNKVVKTTLERLFK